MPTITSITAADTLYPDTEYTFDFVIDVQNLNSGSSVTFETSADNFNLELYLSTDGSTQSVALTVESELSAYQQQIDTGNVISVMGTGNRSSRM